MKRFLNFRLSIFIALAVCLGVLLVKNIYLGNLINSIIFGIGAIFICLCPFLFNQPKFKSENLIITIVLALILSLSALNVFINFSRFEKANLNDDYYLVEGRVDSIVDKGEGVSITLSKAKVEGYKNGKLKHKILVYASGECDGVDIGSIITFNAYLSDNNLIEGEKLSAYSVRNKVKYTASISPEEITIVDYRPTIFQRVNLFIRDALKGGLSDQAFAVAYGMLTGNDELIDGDLMEDFRNAGVAHVFAVSGLHIGFLATALAFILGKLKINKIVGFVITLTTLIFYSGICGFSVSSVRAVIMCGVLLSTRFLGVKYDVLSSLGLACVVVLFINPADLFCAGFQLSFVVVAGLGIMVNPLTRLFKFMPYKLASALSTGITAQVFGLPLCIYLFGKGSLIALFINLVFIPFASILFTFTLLLTLLGGLFNIASVTLFLPNLLLIGVNYLIQLIDYKIFLIGGFALDGFLIVYYLALSFLCGKFNLKLKPKCVIAIILVVIFLLGTILGNIVKNNKDKMLVIGTGTTCATLIRNDRQNFLIVSRTGDRFLINKLASVLNKEGVASIDYLVIADNKNHTDLQVLVTKLSPYFSINNVVYYGEKRYAEERALKTFFKDIGVINLKSGGDINDGVKLQFVLDGIAVLCQVDQTKILVVGDYSVPVYNKLDMQVDFIISIDYCEEFSGYHREARVISYLRSKRFEDGQTNGNFYYQFT